MYVLISGIVVTIAAFLGTKILLTLLICLGMFLFIVKLKDAGFNLVPVQSIPTNLEEEDTLVLESLTSAGEVQNKIVARISTFDTKARFTYCYVPQWRQHSHKRNTWA